MKKIFDDFFGNPAFLVMVAIFTVILLLFLCSPERQPETTGQLATPPETSATSATLENSEISETSSSTTSETTSAVSSLMPVIAEITQVSEKTGVSRHIVKDFSTQTRKTTTTVSGSSSSSSGSTTVTTNAPHDYNFSYNAAGESPNSSYYQDRLAIIGDSIAYGFNAYGYIPYEHNIAQESLALWNIDSYYFDISGGLGVLGTASYVNAPLYYISIGMNDIYGYSADEYGSKLLLLAQDVLARVPTATVIVGTITPVTDWNYYTTNETIDSFNASIRSAVTGAGNKQILFFDANSVLRDPYTGALNESYAGGDGLHLSGNSYQAILNGLFNFLDTQDVKKQIEKHDTTAY